MTKVAEDSGLGRESLYKALKPGAKPGFFTIAKLVAALGVNFRVAVMGAKPKAGSKRTAKKAPPKTRSGKAAKKTGKSKVAKQAAVAAHKRAAA